MYHKKLAEMARIVLQARFGNDPLRWLRDAIDEATWDCSLLILATSADINAARSMLNGERNAADFASHKIISGAMSLI